MPWSSGDRTHHARKRRRVAHEPTHGIAAVDTVAAGDYLSHMPLVELICSQCKKPFSVERWRLRDNPHLCSRKCIYAQQLKDENVRFDEKTTTAGQCVVWNGGISRGRPIFRYDKKSGWAQDFSFLRAGGELDADHYAVSACGNGLCVSPDHLAIAKRLTTIESFWAKVDKIGTGGCWNWTGAKKETGYGAFRFEGRTRRPHQLSFEWAGGVIPLGMDLCHRCDNRLCVNPEHLFVGTRTDNMQDAVSKGRVEKGNEKNNAKLTDGAVAEILALSKRGVSLRDLSARFGVAVSLISSIRNGRRWSHISRELA